MSDSPKPAANTSERVLETAARILAPLVRLLIAKGVTFQMASEVLKQVYVRVAQKQFADDDEATGTKLSLLTGLNRKEIRRLRGDGLRLRGDCFQVGRDLRLHVARCPRNSAQAEYGGDGGAIPEMRAAIAMKAPSAAPDHWGVMPTSPTHS